MLCDVGKGAVSVNEHNAYERIRRRITSDAGGRLLAIRRICLPALNDDAGWRDEEYSRELGGTGGVEDKHNQRWQSQT